MASKSEHTIKQTVELSGEAEFKSALSGIDRELRVMASEMKSVTAGYDKNDKSAENLTAQNKVLEKQISSEKDKLELLKKQLAGTNTETESGKKAADGLRVKINNAEAAVKTMTRQLDSNEQALKDEASQAGKTGDKLGTAGKAAKDSGDKANKSKDGWNKLKTGMKAATAVIAATAAAVTAVCAGIVKMTTDAAKAADDINTLAVQTGLSTSEIQKFQAASELIDVDLETMTGSMSKLTRNMQSAKQGSKNTAEAFASLGVSITDSNGNLRSNQDVFNESISALGRMENETQRDALAMQIFGKSAQDLNPLIKGGADTLKSVGDELEKNGLLLDELSLNKLNALKDQIDTAKANLGAFKNVLAVAFSGELTKAAESVNSALTQMAGAYKTSGFTGMVSEAGKIVNKMASEMVAGLPNVIDAGSQIIGELLNGVVSALPTLVDGVVKIIPTIVTSLLGMLPQLGQAALDIVSALANGLKESLPVLVPAAISAILDLCNTLLSADSIKMLVQAALDIILALAKGLLDALPSLMEQLPEIIEGICTGLCDSIPLLMDAAVELIFSLAEYITNPDNLEKMYGSSIKIITALAGGIVKAATSAAGGLWNAVKKVCTAIGDFFTNGGDLKDIGKNIWNGIVKGIQDAISHIGDVCNSIVNGFKSALGIHSPSRVFRNNIGKYMGQGAGQGFLDGFTSQMHSITGKMQRAVPSLAVDGTSFDTGIAGDPQYVYNVIQVDGRSVGSVITPYVSRAQGLELVRGSR